MGRGAGPRSQASRLAIHGRASLGDGERHSGSWAINGRKRGDDGYLRSLKGGGTQIMKKRIDNDDVKTKNNY